MALVWLAIGMASSAFAADWSGFDPHVAGMMGCPSGTQRSASAEDIDDPLLGMRKMYSCRTAKGVVMRRFYENSPKREAIVSELASQRTMAYSSYREHYLALSPEERAELPSPEDKTLRLMYVFENGRLASVGVGWGRSSHAEFRVGENGREDVSVFDEHRDGRDCRRETYFGRLVVRTCRNEGNERGEFEYSCTRPDGRGVSLRIEVRSRVDGLVYRYDTVGELRIDGLPRAERRLATSDAESGARIDLQQALRTLASLPGWEAFRPCDALSGAGMVAPIETLRQKVNAISGPVPEGVVSSSPVAPGAATQVH